MRRPWVRHFWFILLAVLLIIGFLWVAVESASAHGTYVATQDFIQTHILDPHHSVMTGEQVMSIEAWYGVPAHMTIALWGAETSLGDPRLGGDLVKVFNVGCLRAFPGWQATKWGSLASGTVTIRGKQWLAFPNAWAGAMAWGRYMKVGPTSHPGAYRPYFDSTVWTYQIYRSYYGEGVAGFSSGLSNLRAIDAKYIRLAAAHGFGW